VIDRESLPKPLDALLRTIEDATVTDEERASTFARGLAIGVLVGAAIAGSTLWQRRHASPRRVLTAISRRPAPSDEGPGAQD
jgi:hypothetical protein